MAQRDYYLLTLLPGLDTLGQRPPLTTTDLVAKLQPDSGEEELVETVLLSDDLLQRDAVLSGELDEPTPAVLSVAQITDEMPLPDYLAGEPGGAGNRLPADRVWEQYFRHVAEVADRRHSAFLAEWVGFEVDLRNEVAAARARALGLEPTDYEVALDLAGDAKLASIVNEWSGAANPLEAQRVLDLARWEWIEEHGRYFSFSSDELVAYAARLLLTERWHRLTMQMEQTHAESNADAAGAE